MSLGRRLLPLLVAGWLACVVVTGVTIATDREDIALMFIGLTCLFAALMLAAPALLFLVYARRGPEAVPQEMRRSAIGSGASNLIVGGLLVFTVWSLGMGKLLLAGTGAMALLGAAVLVRVFTLGKPPRALPDAETPVLRHRGATVAGVITMLLFIILAPKAVGGSHSTGTASPANMRSDLRNLVVAQDALLAARGRYGSLAELTAAEPSYRADFSHAEITVVADSNRFVATASSPTTSWMCIVWSGTPAPPADSVHGAVDGVPECWER